METLTVAAADNLLSAWTALEVLSPEIFSKKEKLAGGDKEAIIPMAGNTLPWGSGGKQPAQDKKLFYQVVIGALKLQEVEKQLHTQFPDPKGHREPRSAARRAVMAVALVDHNGCLLKDFPSVALSSFAWGVPLALGGALQALGDWSQVESSLLIQLDELLRRSNEQGSAQAIDKPLLERAYQQLVEHLGLPATLMEELYFAIQYEQAFDPEKPPLPPPLLLILNSFYLTDLAQARDSLEKGSMPKLLQSYLGLQRPQQRTNLLQDKVALAAAVAPRGIPPARWPSRSDHALVLLQQAAVNLALNQLPKGEILAVNGPPGTGKTTLLRDVVAGLVSQRAEALCQFDDPATAFTSNNLKKITLGKGLFELYQVDKSLKGFELLCVSSNNKAVENISRELPMLEAIAEHADELHYFRLLSDKLLNCDSWGLVAATLGNANNCSQFNQAFWWDKEVNLKNYLKYINKSGRLEKEIEIIDQHDSTKNKKRHSKMILQNPPPRGHTQALKCWQQAREQFQTRLARTRKKLAKLEAIHQLFQAVEALTPEALDLPALEAKLAADHGLKMGWFSRWFRPSRFRFWQQLQPLTEKQQRILQAQALQQQCPPYREQLGDQLIDQQRLDQEAAGVHQTVPWCDQAIQRLRDQLFITAIQLHKAFIDAAAKPLYHNLSVFMGQLTNPYLLQGEQQAALADLWSSFFLVVPCVSTTFASIQRMLGKLPFESLGWLLIDEAGQAAPQAAVGALLRSQRAIVVGDPLQIEPVVTLSQTLTVQICQHFGVDPQRFNAPVASVQTLADQASAYYAAYAERSVGVPLLVHRRCSDPMFRIANRIAYDGVMVQAKQPGNSVIRYHLGSSAWFNVVGEAEELWSPAEGEQLIRLLSQLTELKQPPDLYIITPFKMVAQRLKKLIKKSQLLQGWNIPDKSAWLDERVGTVHQVQGREAEAVIMVLGAPLSDQIGSRAWAGRKPNLLNVALTRAKEVFYVIGNRDLWGKAGCFSVLDDWIDIP